MNTIAHRRTFMKQSARAGAFTIIEMLVVITIVALLLSFLLPSLTRTRNLSTRIKCASNMHQAIVATLSYSADCHDLPYNYNNLVAHPETLSHDYALTYNNQTNAHYYGEGAALNGFWESYLYTGSNSNSTANYVTSPDVLGCAFSCPASQTVWPATWYDLGTAGVSINTTAQITKAPPFVYRGPSAIDDYNIDILACGQIAWANPVEPAYNTRSGSWYPHGSEIDSGKIKPLFTCPVFMLNSSQYYSLGESYAAPHNDNSVRTRASLSGGYEGRYGHYLSESVGWTDGHAGGYEQSGPGGTWFVNYEGQITQDITCDF